MFFSIGALQLLSVEFQMAHLATTYAAVNSLVTIGGEKALASINRYKRLVRTCVDRRSNEYYTI